MRILVIGVRYPPETFLRRKFEALAARGFEVHVTSASAGLPARPENGVVWHQTPSMSAPLPLRFAIVVRSATAALFRSPLDFLRLWRHLSVRARSLPMAIAPWVRFLVLSGLKPDIVHFEWNFAAVEHLPVFDFFGTPVVISCRGAHISIAPHTPDRADKTSLLVESFIRAARIHVVSDAMKQEVVRLGADASKLEVIRPAVDPIVFSPGPPRRSGPGPVMVMSTGSVIWRKGYEYALVALRRAREQGLNCRFTIVGGGPKSEMQRLRYTIDDLNMGDCVAIAGELPTAQVLSMLRECDIFLLSSLSEGISNAVLEAMSVGLPVVSTNVGGMDEAVVDGVTGFLVPPRNANRMSEAVLRLAADPALRKRMGTAGRRRILDLFTIDDQAAQWEALYRDRFIRDAASQGPIDADPRPLQNVF